MMITNLKEFFESEYDNVVNTLKCSHDWATTEQIVNASIQRCLGAAEFVLYYAGYDFSKEQADEVDEIYDEVRGKLIALMR